MLGLPGVDGEGDGVAQDVLGPPSPLQGSPTCDLLRAVGRSFWKGHILVSCLLLAAQRRSGQPVWKAGHSGGDIQTRSGKQRGVSATPRSTAMESQGFLVFWAL